MKSPLSEETESEVKTKNLTVESDITKFNPKSKYLSPTHLVISLLVLCIWIWVFRNVICQMPIFSRYFYFINLPYHFCEYSPKQKKCHISMKRYFNHVWVISSQMMYSVFENQKQMKNYVRVFDFMCKKFQKNNKPLSWKLEELCKSKKIIKFSWMILCALHLKQYFVLLCLLTLYSFLGYIVVAVIQNNMLMFVSPKGSLTFIISFSTIITEN